MLSSGNNLSALFRTLAPEESDFNAVAKVVAPSAGQEWPLFKVVAPSRPEPTPPLTPQERKRWSARDGVRAEPPTPGLTMSGLSSKLARSLNQIAEQSPSEAVQTMEPETAGQSLRRMNLSVPGSVAPAPTVRPSLFSKPSPVIKPPVNEEKAKVVGLFERPLAQPALTSNSLTGTARVPVNAGDSLSTIFGRLEASGNVAVRPPEKRSALSTRLGKR